MYIHPKQFKDIYSTTEPFLVIFDSSNRKDTVQVALGPGQDYANTGPGELGFRVLGLP